MKKIVIKVFLIVLLIGIIVALGIFIGSGKSDTKQIAQDNSVIKTYALTDKALNPSIILKDNVFDTQIQDLNINFDKYEGKTVQIEGLYFTNTVGLETPDDTSDDHTYVFVGRYSVNNLCPTCPAGYSYFEFEWHGEEELDIKEEVSQTGEQGDWIRVTGKLTRGNDGVEYYYIDAQKVEILANRGLDTVSN